LKGVVDGNYRVNIFTTRCVRTACSQLLTGLEQFVIICNMTDEAIDILYTLDSASNYSAIQKLKP
jgi:hypothetical protein